MISALAFLPPADVGAEFVELCRIIRNVYNEEVDELLEYFRNTYVGRYPQNAPARPPLFAINVWNMYHRTDDELPRANNSVEVIMVFKLTQKFRCLLYSFLLACIGLLLYLFLI